MIRNSDVQVYEIAGFESGVLNWKVQLFPSLNRWNGAITAKIKKLPSRLLNEEGLRHIGYRNVADHLFPLFPPLFALS